MYDQGNGAKVQFESDGKQVKMSVAAKEAILVLGWSAQELNGSGDGALSVAEGSTYLPADANVTVYRLVPEARWPATADRPDIRCHDFADCPVPPPPIPPWPFRVQVIVRGR
jgi:hypothetical protein